MKLHIIKKFRKFRSWVATFIHACSTLQCNFEKLVLVFFYNLSTSKIHNAENAWVNVKRKSL